MKTRCDSFVVETNVHFPTDINLLFDAIRKTVELIANLCKKSNLHGWRQSEYNIKQIKTQLLKLQRLKHSTSKNPEKAEKKKKEIINKHKEYVESSKFLIKKAEGSIGKLKGLNVDTFFLEKVIDYIKHAKRQIDQIIRRVINGELIPHNEKVFSIFEPHTEWISKGKAGVPVELGLRVAIIEDQYGFILEHEVMEKVTDEQIAVNFIKRAKENYPVINSCSFDKGFHSVENQDILKETLNVVALPKKGKLSKIDIERETSKEFVNAKKKHSSVESAINALEVHGLDVCLDHGMNGFKRYVSLAVVSRNIQIIGAILTKQEKCAMEKERKRRRAA